MTGEPINLDPARTARGPIPTRDVIVNGETFTVPARLSVPLGAAALKGDLAGILAGLFGEQMEAVLALDPPLEMADLLAIVQALAGGPGNLPGSTGS